MTNSKIVILPVASLEHHPENPRKEIGDITELTESIKLDGNVCSCYEATQERKIQNKIIETNNSIDELFRACDTGEYEIPIQIIELLEKTNELIANELIKSINLKISPMLTVSIATDTKGAIKVNRKKVYSDTIQVGEKWEVQ